MEINWLSVVIATIAGVAIGATWFGPKTFFPLWWKLLGKSPSENPGNESMGVVFGLTFVGAFIQATVMAVAVSLAETATGGLQWYEGLAFGALLGVGFSAATSLSHKLFGGFGLKVWLLEVGQDIVSLAAMGAIVSAML